MPQHFESEQGLAEALFPISEAAAIEFGEYADADQQAQRQTNRLMKQQTPKLHQTIRMIGREMDISSSMRQYYRTGWLTSFATLHIQARQSQLEIPDITQGFSEVYIESLYRHDLDDSEGVRELCLDAAVTFARDRHFRKVLGGFINFGDIGIDGIEIEPKDVIVAEDELEAQANEFNFLCIGMHSMYKLVKAHAEAKDFDRHFTAALQE